MTYTESQLAKIREYAGLFLTITDISFLIEVDADELRNDIENHCTEVSKAYHLGKLDKIIPLRKIEIEQAELGSNTSIELMQKYKQQQEADE